MSDIIRKQSSLDITLVNFVINKNNVLKQHLSKQVLTVILLTICL